MFDLLLRRARLVDDTLTDIAIQDGKIAALGEISAPSRKTIELNGKVYVSAGWIDSHVHCYPNSPIYHDEPDSVGIATGVTTVIDAGSTGADDVDDFYQLTRKAATEVYALLNISRVGLIAQNELANMANIVQVGRSPAAAQRGLGKILYPTLILMIGKAPMDVHLIAGAVCQIGPHRRNRVNLSRRNVPFH